MSLEKLVRFASENSVLHIVYSVAKIVVPRYKPIPEVLQRLKQVYEYITKPERIVFRGGSWRLPETVSQEQIIKPFLKICTDYHMKAFAWHQSIKHCKALSITNNQFGHGSSLPVELCKIG